MRKNNNPQKRNQGSSEKPRTFSQDKRKKNFKKKPFQKFSIKGKKEEEKAQTTRLNRYIAQAGVCSRREADVLIANGEVKVNGKVITEMGYQVQKGDTVKYKDQVLRTQKSVYILLNKPKGFITTTKDPRERRTVMDLVKTATKERIYPVGRLDRNTTGLLLFTNDGELSRKLMHPSFEVKKVYKVTLDKPITEEDFNKIKAGLELEDGLAKVDALQVLTPEADVLGLEIHIGKNRIVRRIFEHLDYEVLKLDRTLYGNLTKKDLSRGHWRTLSDKEVITLKHLV